MPTIFRLATAIAAALALHSAASAQLATQFNFNDSTTNVNVNGTSGTPTVAVLGAPTASFLANTGGNGANSTDPNAAGFAYHLTSWASQGADSGLNGLQMNLPTTSGSGGFSNLILRFDQRHSGTSSRFFELQYTTNGTTWQTLTTTTASAVDAFVTQTFDFTGITAANNNANFAIRSLSVFAPSTSEYAPTNGAGTYSGGGTIRYDMISLSQARSWASNPATNDLTAGSNYAGNPTLTTTETLLFGASSTTTLNVPATATFDQVVFQAGAPNYTINATAGQSLNLGTGIANLGTGSQTFTAPVNFAGGATVRSNGTVNFNGAIAVGNGAGLVLAGTGTVNVNSTYTGNDISMATGMTLGGIGTIQNEIHNYGGTVRGGIADGINNYGTLTISLASGDLEFYTAPSVSVTDPGRAPTLQVEAIRTGANTVNNSRISLVGGSSVDLELNDAGVGANKFRIQLLSTGFIAGETYAMTILTTDSIGSIEFNNASQADGAVIPASSYDLHSPNIGIQSATLTVVDVSGGGSTLVLTFTPVPEPMTLLALAGGGGLAVAAWRRRISP